MSNLSQLLEVLPEARRVGEGEPEIRGIAYDSRKVEPGDLFACLPGTKTDGRPCSCRPRASPWRKRRRPSTVIRRDGSPSSG
jgi:UDP-N-acetylmuramyl pentapeptide synthase